MKKQKNTSYIIYIALILVIGGALYYFSMPKKSDYDAFASCISEKGAVMYGTWWCPHCKDQKDEFGTSWDIIKEKGGYVECSTAERAQMPICKENGITSYPTWKFADGSELLGKQSFYTLGNKTACLQSLPLKSD